MNILGCAALGALAEYLRIAETGMIESAISTRATLGIRYGFLGALTTFSTFAGESFVLAGSGRWGVAAIYVAANFCIGLFALAATAMLVKQWMT